MYIAKIGLPETLATDNGTDFKNNKIITMCHLYKLITSPDHFIPHGLMVKSKV